MGEDADLAGIEALFKSRDSRYATVAFVDLQGQLRGKTINANKLLGAYPSGVPFSPLNMMLDFGDHTLFPRGYLTPDLDVTKICHRSVSPRPTTP